MQMMFLLDGVFNFNMINYLKVRFLDYEESAFYLPRHSLKASPKS